MIRVSSACSAAFLEDAEDEEAVNVQRKNRYRAYRGNPVSMVDPMGLAGAPTTGPAPAAKQALQPLPQTGSATIRDGKYAVDVQFSLSNLAATHWPKGTYQVLYLAKLKKRADGAACRRYLFYDYGETSTGNNGADRYPDPDRKKNSKDWSTRLDDPYGFSIYEQARVNAGNAWGGALKDVYDNTWEPGGKGATADAIMVDPAGTNSKPYHHAVTSLIIASDRADFKEGNVPAAPTDQIIGAIHWEWDVDAAGTITGAVRVATKGEIGTAMKSLYPPYTTKFLSNPNGPNPWFLPGAQCQSTARLYWFSGFCASQAVFKLIIRRLPGQSLRYQIPTLLCELLWTWG